MRESMTYRVAAHLKIHHYLRFKVVELGHLSVVFVGEEEVPGDLALVQPDLPTLAVNL